MTVDKMMSEEERLDVVAKKAAQAWHSRPGLVFKHLPESKWLLARHWGCTKENPPKHLLEPVPVFDLGHVGDVARHLNDLMILCDTCKPEVALKFEPEAEPDVVRNRRQRVLLDILIYRFRVNYLFSERPPTIHDYAILVGQCAECHTIYHGYGSIV